MLELFELDPTAYYVIGRVFVSLWGVLTIAVTYAIGRQVANWLVGVLAAALLAFSPLHIFISQVARTDSPVTFFSNLSVLAAMMIVSRPIWRRYALAGITTGLATSTKYYGILAGVALPIAHVLMLIRSGLQGRQWLFLGVWNKLLLALLLVPVAFALTSPFAVIDWETARSDLANEFRDTHLSADGLSPAGNAWWYLSDVLPDAIGVVATLLIPIGLWAARRKANAEIVVPISYALLFFVTISLHPLHWDRWLAPILPVLAILSSLGLIFIVGSISLWTKWPLVRPAIFVLLLVLLLAAPLYQSIFVGVERTLPDTRLVAREWIHNNIPEDSRIALESYTSPLDNNRFDMQLSFTLSQKSVDFYCQESFEYAIVSTAIYDRFMTDPEHYATDLSFYDQLRKRTDLIYEAAPITWKQAGPTVSVYRLTGCEEG